MVDTVTFAAPGTETFDSNTGTYVTAPGATLYTGACQVQVGAPSPRDATVGEQEIVLDRTIIKIPVSSTDIPPGSVAEITAVAAISDPSLVGNRYRVIGTHAGTYKTARRLPCELISS